MLLKIQSRFRQLNITRIKYVLFVFLLLSISLNSCYKDRLKLDKIAGGKWNPKIAIPLAHANLAMSRIIQDEGSIWKEDPDGLLSIIYSAKSVSEIGDVIITIPDQLFDTTVNFALLPTLPVGDSISVLFTLENEFASGNNERIDSVLIKNGTIEFEITTDLNHDGYLEIDIPNLTHYGTPLHKKIDLSYTSGITIVNVVIPLNDYYLKLDNSNGNNNQMEQNIKLSVTKTNNPDNTPYYFSLKQEIKSLHYYLAMGNFQQHSFNVDETTIPLDLYSTQISANVFLEQSNLFLTFHNSYGIPTNITFNEFYAERDGVKLDLTSNLLPTLSINYPSFNNIGGEDTTIFHFDASNSNITDIIHLNPQKVVFSGIVTTNPLGSSVDNFVLDTSRISLDVKIEIPLYGKALHFVLHDTTNVNIGDSINNETGINKVTLNINSENGFPFDIDLQIYFADSLGNIVDSVFQDTDNILLAADVSPAPEYRVIEKKHNIKRVILNDSQIQSYNKAKKIIMSIGASTTNSGQDVVKIYSDYSVDIEVSASVEYETEF